VVLTAGVRAQIAAATPDAINWNLPIKARGRPVPLPFPGGGCPSASCPAMAGQAQTSAAKYYSLSISMPFNTFNLGNNILKAVQEAGYIEPTPIQSAAIPLIVAGHDLIGIAQTGTGKTAAYV